MFYSNTPNRVRAIAFLLFCNLILFFNGVLKNLYADPRPFWSYKDIKCYDCQTEFGNPSGNLFIKAMYL